MFPLCNAHSNSKLPQHLKVLEERFTFYFPAETCADFDWVLDPWSSSGRESSKGMPLQVQKQLADQRGDHSLKMKFQDIGISAVANSAVEVLIPFSTTYLCELSFSCLTYIKNKYRERLRTVDQELHQWRSQGVAGGGHGHPP